MLSAVTAPDSILARSSRSLISESRSRPEAWMVCANFTCFAVELAARVVGQQAREDQQAVERRAQLVRHVGEELRLRLVRPLGGELRLLELGGALAAPRFELAHGPLELAQRHAQHQAGEDQRRGEEQQQRSDSGGAASTTSSVPERAHTAAIAVVTSRWPKRNAAQTMNGTMRKPARCRAAEYEVRRAEQQHGEERRLEHAGAAGHACAPGATSRARAARTPARRRRRPATRSTSCPPARRAACRRAGRAESARTSARSCCRARPAART